MIIDTTALESRVQELGSEIFAQVQATKLSVFDPERYTGKLMDWAMQDEDFKVSLFRFVDVFPSLLGSEAIIRHAQEYFQPVGDRIPGLLRWGFKVDPHSIAAKLAAPVIARQIRSMAERFIVGQDGKSALKQLRKIRQGRMAFTVDLLGEATLSEPESDAYLKRYLELLSTLSEQIPNWRESRPLIEGHKGEHTPINISVKLSALYSQVKSIAPERSVSVLSERLGEIVSQAKEHGAYVYVDMEDTSFVDITIETFKKVMSSLEFRSYDRAGIVLQAYLRRTERDLDGLIEWVKGRGTPVGVRLVKGAYWDTETIMAQQRGWPVPVWQEKSSTDANYEKLVFKLLQNYKLTAPAFGSHNLRSLTFAVSLAEALNVPRSDFELQALYGMAEPIKAAFVDRGFLVREYAPVGELIPGMSYLVRRLLENTSNEGFLRQTFREHESVGVLLARPEISPTDTGTEHVAFDPRREFKNIPWRDFSEQPVRAALHKQIGNLQGKLRNSAEIIKPVISGIHLDTERVIKSFSPEDEEFQVASIHLADEALAERAVAELSEFFPKWRSTPAEVRAEVLFNAAALLDKKRDEFSAIMVLEAGKTWSEADADVCEAIDFCNYYGLQALELFKTRRLGTYPGEYNALQYEGRGVTAVICPWNFPLAIPCGMFAAALVTGNCPVLKPAEQTSLIARMLFDTFLAAGMPEKSAAFLPGLGEVVGPVLVQHPKVTTIVFTGSMEVGLKIVKEAADTKPGFIHVKRVIAEMGGKNAIIVDDDADLDEAIRGVVYSAFGFQGQKCSACSRVYVVGKQYDKFVARLAEAVQSVLVGPATDPATLVGPVIDRESRDRIEKVIVRAEQDCSLLVRGGESVGGLSRGLYVRPAVFVNIPKGHDLLTKEIFGPVLAVCKVESFSQAIDDALSVEFALTGGVFSRSPKNIAEAYERFRVGNLYINRGCTGALVYRQPFGGASMSGVGSKAGGPDYLMQFVIPRAISENTMRRGFAPEL